MQKSCVSLWLHVCLEPLSYSSWLLQREGLDSEYTVTSSSGYLTSSDVKNRNVGSAEVSWKWLQLVRCAYLQLHPGYFEWRLQIEFPECTGTEDVYRNNSKYKYEDERSGGSEFV